MRESPMTPNEAVPHIPEADSFEIHASLDTIKQSFLAHKWLVLATTLVTSALVLAYVHIWPPIFQAEVMIAADSDKDQHRTAFYQGWNIFRKDTLTDEATLMTSTPVLREVIQRLDLKYSDVYHPFSNYVVHLWVESSVGKAYRKMKHAIFPPEVGPYAPTEKELEQYKVLKDFQEGVTVQQVGEASIGLLIVKASSQRAAEIANTLVNVYLGQRRARFVREAEEAYLSLREETDKALSEVKAVEAETKKFYSDNGMLLLFEKERVQIGRWLELGTEITNLEAKVADSESAIRIIDQQLLAEGARLDSGRVFQDNASKERLIRLEVGLADAKQLYQPDSPEVREIEEQIKLAKASISDGSSGGTIVRNMQSIGESYEVLRRKRWELESKLLGDHAALGIKKAEAQRMHALLDKIPGQMQLNQDLERRKVAFDSKYRGLNEKLTMAAVSMATAKSAPASMRVVEYASPPEKPRWPNTKLLLAAAVVFGLLAGTLAALFLDIVFARVSRYRLWNRESDYRVFAIVDRDEKFLETIFPRTQSQR